MYRTPLARRLSILALACAAVLVVASSARASEEENSTVTMQGGGNAGIKLVALSFQSFWPSPVPDEAGEFVVGVLGPGGAPLSGVSVTVDFTGCGDVSIADGQHWGNMHSIACGKVRATTNSNGLATFRVVGSANSSGCSSGESGACARIYVGASLRATWPVACFDLDGVDGVSGADMSLWLADYSCGLYMSRSDYNHDGVVGGSDLSIWLQVYGAGGSELAPVDDLCP